MLLPILGFFIIKNVTKFAGLQTLKVTCTCTWKIMSGDPIINLQSKTINLHMFRQVEQYGFDFRGAGLGGTSTYFT